MRFSVHVVLLAGLSASSSGTTEHGFKSSAFFGSKMNVRSSVVRVAHSRGADAASSTAVVKGAAQKPVEAMSRQQTLVAQYTIDDTRCASGCCTVLHDTAWA